MAGEENNGSATEAAAAAPTVSIEDELSAAFDRANAPEATTNTSAAGDAPAGANAAAPKAPAATGSQQRDAAGKFTKPDGSATETAKSETQTTPDGAKPAVVAATPGSDSEQAKPGGPQTPPASWSVEAKSLWDSAPPALKDAVLKREQEVTEQFHQIGQQVKPYIEIGKILAPRSQALAVSYGSAENAVNLWAQMNDFAVHDVKGFIKWYADQRGVNLAELVGGQGGMPQQQQTYQDPQMATLAGQVQELSSFVQTQLAEQQQKTYEQYATEVERFAADPKNLYFANVRDDMAALIRAGLATTVEQAYEQAIWRNPEVRPKLLAAQASAADEQRKAEAAKRAAEATRVNATNLTSAGSVAGTTPLSRDEELAAAYDRMNNAA